MAILLHNWAINVHNQKQFSLHVDDADDENPVIHKPTSKTHINIWVQEGFKPSQYYDWSGKIVDGLAILFTLSEPIRGSFAIEVPRLFGYWVLKNGDKLKPGVFVVDKIVGNNAP